MQMEDRQKSWKVAKEALSKLLFHVQELKAAIENKKSNGMLSKTTTSMSKVQTLHIQKVHPRGMQLKLQKPKPLNYW